MVTGRHRQAGRRREAVQGMLLLGKPGVRSSQMRERGGVTVSREVSKQRQGAGYVQPCYIQAFKRGKGKRGRHGSE